MVNKAKPIKTGDTIGVLALSSPCQQAIFTESVNFIESQGFKVCVALEPCKEYGQKNFMFSSAAAKERAKALEDLYKNEDIKAIFAARGAYGVLEVLPHLDFDVLKKWPLPLIGFSDTSTALIALYQGAQVPCVHGPSFSSFSNTIGPHKEEFEALVKMLSGAKSELLKGQDLSLLCGPDQAQGVLIGGNLSSISSLMGTPWEPDFKDHILFFEELSERPYRIHRMLLAMKLAGKFEDLRAVVIGSLDGCSHPKALGPDVYEVIKDIFSEFSIPVVYNAPFGHGQNNYPLPLGIKAEIVNNKLRLLEDFVTK